MEEAQPEPLKAAEIDAKLGATWIPAHYIEDFLVEVFDTPREYFNGNGMSVTYTIIRKCPAYDGRRSQRIYGIQKERRRMNLVNMYEKMRELKNDNVISFSRVLADLN